MSWLSNGLEWHNPAAKQAGGEEVLYFRGENKIELTATLGETDFEQIDSNDVRSMTKAMDFLIDPAELVFEGSILEPEKGDQIRRSNGEVFDVTTGFGVPWEWSDAYRTHYRVHTVRRRVKSL